VVDGGYGVHYNKLVLLLALVLLLLFCSLWAPDLQMLIRMVLDLLGTSLFTNQVAEADRYIGALAKGRRVVQYWTGLNMYGMGRGAKIGSDHSQSTKLT
jgi:hypothetical protein